MIITRSIPTQSSLDNLALTISIEMTYGEWQKLAREIDNGWCGSQSEKLHASIEKTLSDILRHLSQYMTESEIG